MNNTNRNFLALRLGRELNREELQIIERSIPEKTEWWQGDTKPELSDKLQEIAARIRETEIRIRNTGN